MQHLSEILQEMPVIAAVKDDVGLEKCLESECLIVFVLYGNICSISSIVSRIKLAGKMAFVHVDLIIGLSSKDVVVDYIKQNTIADGIISTKANIIKKAKELGLLTIQRFFVLDSLSFNNVLKQIDMGYADMLEILPGVMPKIIKKITAYASVPIVAGGLIYDKEDILSALNAGASAISATTPEVWFM